MTHMDSPSWTLPSAHHFRSALKIVSIEVLQRTQCQLTPRLICYAFTLHVARRNTSLEPGPKPGPEPLGPSKSTGEGAQFWGMYGSITLKCTRGLGWAGMPNLANACSCRSNKMYVSKGHIRQEVFGTQNFGSQTSHEASVHPNLIFLCIRCIPTFKTVYPMCIPILKRVYPMCIPPSYQIFPRISRFNVPKCVHQLWICVCCHT